LYTGAAATPRLLHANNLLKLNFPSRSEKKKTIEGEEVPSINEFWSLNASLVVLELVNEL
jgi:hypothetical protein